MIDILMSTYNGARFLPEQLDSILGQDFRDFRLLVRDDGSKDETVAIVRSYANGDERISIISDEAGNLGAPASFMKLAAASDADLFMFADQDDVWKLEKISKTLGKIKAMASEAGEETPLAVFSDLKVVDENLRTIDESFWHFQKLDPELCRDWKSLLAQNVVAGCTLMANRAAKEFILPFKLPEMMHDHWVAANVARHGKIDFISESTVLYRQHGRNAEGARDFGPKYAASKLPGLLGKLSFYRRAAQVFGGTTAFELMRTKVRINAKRL